MGIFGKFMGGLGRFAMRHSEKRLHPQLLRRINGREGVYLVYALTQENRGIVAEHVRDGYFERRPLLSPRVEDFVELDGSEFDSFKRRLPEEIYVVDNVPISVRDIYLS
jgi:hypothetical protein|tara:strand:+ start:45913 stop:46239 length:327 start_codon:yes stop_codon:yes gene_type:complete